MHLQLSLPICGVGMIMCDFNSWSGTRKNNVCEAPRIVFDARQIDA